MKNKILHILVCLFIAIFNDTLKCQDNEFISILFNDMSYIENINYNTVYHNIVIKGNSTSLIDNCNKITSCYLISNIYDNNINKGVKLTNKNFLLLKNIPYNIYDIYIYYNGESNSNFYVNNLPVNLKNNNINNNEAKYFVFKELTNKEIQISMKNDENIFISAIQIIKNESTTTKRENYFTIYPNPCNNYTKIKFNNNYIGNVSIHIIEENSKEVLSLNRFKSNILFEETLILSNLSNGRYYIVIEFDNKKYSLPLIKN